MGAARPLLCGLRASAAGICVPSGVRACVRRLFLQKLHMPESIDTARLLEALEEIRSEMREQRALLRESIDQGRSLEMQVDAHLLTVDQRVKELTHDLELMIKSELMGLFGDFDSRGSGGRKD